MARRRRHRLDPRVPMAAALALLVALAATRNAASPSGDGTKADADGVPREQVASAATEAVREVDELSGHEVLRTTSSEEVAGELPEVAADELGRYEEQGSCVLVRAGYLDLLGDVWSCTVVGDGWVDTCVVSAHEGGEACTVTCVRMVADES